MTAMADGRRGGRGHVWRILGWGGAAALLCVPALAMRFAPEAGVNWTASDFVVMGAMLGIAGLGLELAVRASASLAYRAGAAVAVFAAFLTIWANLAVGMVGAEGDPFNFLFLGVLALALLGAVAARFRAEGLVRAMLATASAQAAAGAAGTFIDLRGGILSALFAGFWLAAAWLFHRAARA